jgi:uncharacterized protein (TIGR00251 family)
VIRLEDIAGGIVVLIRAQPGARKNGVIGEHDGALKVAVTAPPDKGKANEAVITVLAETFSLPKSAVQILSGQTSRQKRVLLNGASHDNVEQTVARLLKG